MGEAVAEAAGRSVRVIVTMTVGVLAVPVVRECVLMVVVVRVCVFMVVVPVAHAAPLSGAQDVDMRRPRSHYVRMSARMHLSPAHHAHPRTPGEEQFALAAELLALLGDRTRLTLLHALTAGEADVTSLTEVCGAARPAVSQHLARLRLAGLVGTRKEGRRVVYSLRHGHLRRLVDEALKVADHRLTETSTDSPTEAGS
jgi:DNA-binding transcriptional ArsR family regulator